MIRLTTQQKTSAIFLVAVGVALTSGVLAYSSVSRLRSDATWVAHTHEVIGALNAVQSAALETDVGEALEKVRSLTADNTLQQRRIDYLNSLVRRRAAGTVEAVQLDSAIRLAVTEMIDEERRLLNDRRARADKSSAWVLLGISGVTLLAMIVALIAHVFIRRDFARAEHAEQALREANAGLETNVAARTQELKYANDRLYNACQELRALAEQAPLAIAMFDREMRYIATSERWVKEYGRGRSALIGVNHYDVHPDMPDRWREIHRRALAGECVRNEDEMWVQADGSQHWLSWAVSPWRDEHGDIAGMIIIAEDVTPRKRAEERVRLAHAVFENMQEGLVITDLAGHIVAVNPAFRSSTEYTEEELIGRQMRSLRSGHHDMPFYEAMWKCINATGSWQGEIWDRRKGGEVYPHWIGISTVRDEEGKPKYFVGVSADISRMRHASSHLQYLAHHDALTGLPNRSLLSLRLRHSIERAHRDGGQCAVLFLDLDRFKEVNDRWGHEAGDELLRLAAARMQQRLRDIDTLARLGGDEFVLVLEQVSVPSDAARVAQSLIEHLIAPFRLRSGVEAYIGASVGISLYPMDGNDAESLVRQADAALYQAKLAGRCTHRFASGEKVSRAAEPCS